MSTPIVRGRIITLKPGETTTAVRVSIEDALMAAGYPQTAEPDGVDNVDPTNPNGWFGVSISAQPPYYLCNVILPEQAPQALIDLADAQLALHG